MSQCIAFCTQKKLRILTLKTNKNSGIQDGGQNILCWLGPSLLLLLNNTGGGALPPNPLAPWSPVIGKPCCICLLPCPHEPCSPCKVLVLVLCPPLSWTSSGLSIRVPLPWLESSSASSLGSCPESNAPSCMSWGLGAVPCLLVWRCLCGDVRIRCACGVGTLQAMRCPKQSLFQQKQLTLTAVSGAAAGTVSTSSEHYYHARCLLSLTTITFTFQFPYYWQLSHSCFFLHYQHDLKSDSCAVHVLLPHVHVTNTKEVGF